MTELAISVYRHVLDLIPRLGRIPTSAEVQRDLRLEGRVMAAALRQLVENGVARLDPDSCWIGAVYPYSAIETAHEVVFTSGVTVHCMCAVDCFYVPFLTGEDIEIRSSCHLCQRSIAIEIGGKELSAVEPPSTIVWDSDAPYDCPKTNFFCCDVHLQRWREGEPSEPGAPRSIDEVLRRGQAAAAHIRQVVGDAPRADGDH